MATYVGSFGYDTQTDTDDADLHYAGTTVLFQAQAMTPFLPSAVMTPSPPQTVPIPLF